MYRSLSDCGPFTGYVYVLPISNHQLQGQSYSDSPPPPRPSHPPRFSPGVSNPSALRGGPKDHSLMYIMSVTESEGTQMTYNATASSQTDEIQVEFIRGGSVSSLTHENTHDKPNSAAYDVV